MLKIKIPNNFQPEREYLLEVIFRNFWGIEYALEFGAPGYEIQGSVGTLFIKDSFFYGDNYFERLPEVKYYQGDFCAEKDLPVLYGEPVIVKQSKRIDCHIDIFAAVFFMLTRWEENLPGKLDCYERFPATRSIAYKNNFLHRPIVDEYAELFWNMLQVLEPALRRKENKFQLYMTHDVDKLGKWRETNIIKEILRSILKRSEQSPAAVWRSYIGARKNIRRDPFYTFPWIMETLREYPQAKKIFYFLSGGNTEYEGYYDIAETGELLKYLRENKAEIGLHGSYLTYRDTELLRGELNKLAEFSGILIKETRQHYLRFSLPDTWRCQEAAGLQIDSSSMYADKEGFRCGTGATFPVFDVLQRRKLNLWERPLLYMDQRDYECGGYKGKKQNGPEVLALIRACQKYKTDCTVLFHNNVLETEAYKQKYLEVLKWAE